MSATAEPSTGIAEKPVDDHEYGHEHHEPFRAHHFDSWQQQFDAGKLGMWAFLVQEVLFFSGLFCFYTVYRALHPEVFEYADQFLSVAHGAVNTVVLLFSSLTMAWGVRCAMLGQRKGLIVCIAVTLFCAALFLGVKSYEYTEKIHAHLVWSGAVDPEIQQPPGDVRARTNIDWQFSAKTAPTTMEQLIDRTAATLHQLEFGFGIVALVALLIAGGVYVTMPDRIGLVTTLGAIALSCVGIIVGAIGSMDLHHYMHGGDHGGQAHAAAGEHAGADHEAAHAEAANAHKEGVPPALTGAERPPRLGTFFGIYFMMTGLHAVHILGGMIVLIWLLARAVKGHFNPHYFGPVDFVGLYWHLVDLVWIFLFPLLYLIG